MTPKQVYEDQVRLQKLREQKNESEKKSEVVHSKSERGESHMALERKGESEVESVEVKKKEKNSAHDVKTERKQRNFYAKASEVKQALISKRMMIVLMYKEALLNTNQLDSSLPSIVVSLCRSLRRCFLKRCHMVYHRSKGLNTKLISFLEH